MGLCFTARLGCKWNTSAAKNPTTVFNGGKSCNRQSTFASYRDNIDSFGQSIGQNHRPAFIFILLTDITFTLICILIAEDHFFAFWKLARYYHWNILFFIFMKLNYDAKWKASYQGGWNKWILRRTPVSILVIYYAYCPAIYSMSFNLISLCILFNVKGKKSFGMLVLIFILFKNIRPENSIKEAIIWNILIWIDNI